MKNKGAIISGLVAIVAIIGLMTVFVTSASPYVTVAQARQAEGDNLHLAGDLVKGSIVNDLRTRQLRFELKDEKGDVMPVVYTGPPPSNMGEATKVVAIGGYKEGALHSDQLLIKCPSKYEGEKKPF